MNARVISYSLTGNNDDLAESLAEALGARHIRITEQKERSIWTTAVDMMFNRAPAVNYTPDNLEAKGPVVFVAPIWMGGVASPMRDCFKRLCGSIDRYCFVSISGGADENPNPKIAVDIKKRLKKDPAAVIPMYIADLLPKEPKPNRDDTSDYRISPADTKRLSEEAISILNKEGFL